MKKEPCDGGSAGQNHAALAAPWPPRRPGKVGRGRVEQADGTLVVLNGRTFPVEVECDSHWCASINT